MISYASWRFTSAAAASYVPRSIATPRCTIARYNFDSEAEFRRRAGDDAVIQLALRLASGAATQRDLFARAAELPKPRADLRTARR